jgi:serine/threonine-protein phosphatase 4 regulatory subunit 1
LDIVPQQLIDHCVLVIDQSRGQTVDSEIARHCTFELPAVALTLCRANWPSVKDAYDVLASDLQWKVRLTLDSSIHQLGIILGNEAVGQDAFFVAIFSQRASFS